MNALQNIEGEAAVLAALLMEPKLVETVADGLRPEDFADKFLGHMFGLIVRESRLGRAVSPLTIRPFLDGEPAFAELGGANWLFSLTASSLPLLAATATARQVRALAERRRLVEGLQAAIEAAGNISTPIETLIEQADSAISGARDTGDGAGELSGADCLDLVINGFDETVAGALCGVIPSIDDLLGPLRPSHLIIGAGRPGMGKTATALSYILGAAERGHGVLMFSLEMGGEQLAERMAADLCYEKRIPYTAIRDRTLTGGQRMEVCRARERIASLPLQIIDRSGLTVGHLRMLVRRWKRRFEARGHKLELVVVDYLQLLRVHGMNGYDAVSEISRTLKEIAKEEGLAVLALSQLSRKVEERDDKRPRLADLRESGQIEQDADAVLFFLRHEYYLRATEPPPDDPKRAAWEERFEKAKGGIEFICAKRRNGTTGSLTGRFDGAYQAVRG